MVILIWWISALRRKTFTHGYNTLFCQHFRAQSSLVFAAAVTMVTHSNLSVFSCQVFLGLPCCLRHFLPGSILEVLRTIVVRRHLQEPLVLDLDRLKGTTEIRLPWQLHHTGKVLLLDPDCVKDEH